LQVIKKASDNSYVQAFQFGSTNQRLMDMDYGYGYLKIFGNNGAIEYTEFTGAVMTWSKSYIHLGDSLLSTITPNGSGSESIEFNHPDRLGTKLTTNQTTGSTSEQTSLPFGTALNSETTANNNTKKFTSYERSARTGLDYAINRTYDSKLGRFTQVDPIRMAATNLVDPQSLNLYSYCGNDPINHVDPDGLFFKKLFKWLKKIVVWAIIIVAAIVATQFVLAVAFNLSLPGFIGNAVASIMGLVGKIGALVSSFAPAGLVAAIGVETAGGVGIGMIFGGISSVGAIANNLQNSKKRKKSSKDSIRKVVERVVQILVRNKKCLNSINFDNHEISPMVGLLHIYNRGDIKIDKELQTMAQAPVGQTDTGFIDLNEKFFNKVIKDKKGNDWNKIEMV
jgi:RHS repeat-associated protein